jgi:hypothetical protein
MAEQRKAISLGGGGVEAGALADVRARLKGSLAADWEYQGRQASTLDQGQAWQEIGVPVKPQ